MIPFNSRLPRLDELVEEVAVSVNINGINHAVMMATPDDLDDFAIGFLFGEGIIGGNHDVHDIQSTLSEHGVVLDIQLPNVSGLDLIAEIKRDATLRNTPVLAVTAYAGKGDEERIREAGAEGYLAKPVSIVPFMTAVRAMLDGRAQDAAA